MSELKNGFNFYIFSKRSENKSARYVGELILFFFLFFSFNLQSQSILDQGENIINYEKLKYYSSEKEGLGTVVSNRAKDQKEITLTVETTTQPDFIYKLSSKIRLEPTRIEKGEILLLSFLAKTEYSNLETGEARMLWILNVSNDPKEKIRRTVSASSEWQQFYIPIQIDRWVNAKQLALTLQYGFPPQKFLLKNLELRVFDKTTNITDLPKTKTTYVGMEADAVWRKDAVARIEQLRKGDFELCFTKGEKRLKNQKVQVQLKQHYFKWGAAVQSKKILKTENYLENIAKAFNLVVFENDLKIKYYDRRIPKVNILQAIDMVQAEGLEVKGHVLIWPGFRHLSPDFKKNKNNPKKIISMMESHVRNILKDTKGKIRSWDVANETYTNQDLQKITGSEEILYNGFRELKKQDAHVLAFTNEYGIISKGGLDTKKQQWYYDYIKRVDKNTGGLVDGIGIQCHIGSDLTSPQKVLEILNFYASLKKQISISEFTLEIDDAEVRKQYTKDFMTAVFSHPAVSEFLFWGVNKEKADIFTKEWKHGMMGEAFFELVHDEWKTNLIVETNKKGMTEGKGFYGTYEYTYVDGNQVKKGTFEFTPETEGVIIVKL